MKVYAVIEESAVDGMHDLDVKLFSKKSTAERYYEKIEAAWVKGCKNWEESHNGFHREMWQDGYYDENHVVLDLEEKDVDESEVEKKYYQVDCLDVNNEPHTWRFYQDAEGIRDAVEFIDWLLDRYKDYHSFTIKHN